MPKLLLNASARIAPGAESFLLWMLAGRVDRPVGSVTYTVMLDVRGGIRSDVTVARLGAERFLIGGNGPRDLAWLRRHVPPDGSVAVSDLTETTCCAALWGPMARAIVEAIVEGDLTFGYLEARELQVGAVPVTATRISYAGESGWELVTGTEHGLALWDAIWEAGKSHGMIAAGRGALGSLRLEKGYRAWGADMTPDHAPEEAGLAFTVRRDGTDFLGRDGLTVRAPAQRRLVCLNLEDDQVAMGGEPVRVNGEPAGYVTSADYGYSVGCSIAYAWVPRDLGAGDRVEIAYFDRMLDATLAEEPLFDPKGERLRS